MTAENDWPACWTSSARTKTIDLLAAGPWVPSSPPQLHAMASGADILGYGGAAGGGKTDLMLGVALTLHRRAILFRREATQLTALEERAAELAGDTGRYSAHKRQWRFPDDRLLRFGALQRAGDWKKYQGQAHDFIGFDEAAHFLESQVRALIGWNRSAHPGQRCRAILAFNPPTTAEGAWILGFFAPWLDPGHPQPARPGELRWFAMIDGLETEVGPDPVSHQGRIIRPKSRTFIPARVEDNPFLMASGYADTLDALPEPLRSQMRTGDFSIGRDDDQWQVVPTAWVAAAQARWTPPPSPVPLTALGVDVARGGRDSTVVTPRHGAWFGPQTVRPGSATPDGPAVAALVVEALAGRRAAIGVDVIGVGGSVYDTLRGMGLSVHPMNGAEASEATDKSGQLRFANRRAEWWWRLREALDPASGRALALPPDRELQADLCAPRWSLAGGRIQVERKEEIVARLGRSPDKGDSAVYALAEPPAIPPPLRSASLPFMRR